MPWKLECTLIEFKKEMNATMMRPMNAAIREFIPHMFCRSVIFLNIKWELMSPIKTFAGAGPQATENGIRMVDQYIMKSR